MNTKKIKIILIYLLSCMFLVFVIGSVLGFGFGYSVVKWNSHTVEGFGSGVSGGGDRGDSDVVFVDQDEFEKIVKKSPYFHLLTPWDLRVRNSNGGGGAGGILSYRNKYIHSRIEMTSEQKSELMSLVKMIDQELGLKSSVLGRIPWKFVIFDGTVEGGLCHTIGNIIMFPVDFFEYSQHRKLQLLIHEKIHVYQRFHSAWASDIIQKWGMSVVGKSGDGSLGWMEDIRRHNPDLDSFDYGFSGNGGARIVELYTGDSSLSDSSTFLIQSNNLDQPTYIHGPRDIGMPEYVGQIEHPYEIMACILPVLVLGDRKPSDFSDVENIVWNALWL